MKPRLEVDPAGRTTSVAVDATPWKIGASQRLTVVAKCTLQLVAAGPGRIVPPDPLAPGSVELTPVLPHPQITVVGHAYAPRGSPRGMQPTRVALLRAGTTSFEKSVLVYGDRTSPTDFPRPFEAMPLVHERAPGGGWNPAGRVIARGDPPPNLVPASSAQPIACFAPIPADFPARAGIYDPAALRHDGDLLAFGLFDFRWFQDAPFDQWVARLEGDETLILEGLSPHVPRLATELPGWVARATWWHDQRESPPLMLRLDRLDVDVDRGVASLVWRGHFALPASVAPRDLRIRVRVMAKADVLVVRGEDPPVAALLSGALAPSFSATLGGLSEPKNRLGSTAKMRPLTEEQIARARNPMPFRARGPEAASEPARITAGAPLSPPAVSPPAVSPPAASPPAVSPPAQGATMPPAAAAPQSTPFHRPAAPPIPVPAPLAVLGSSGLASPTSGGVSPVMPPAVVATPAPAAVAAPPIASPSTAAVPAVGSMVPASVVPAAFQPPLTDPAKGAVPSDAVARLLDGSLTGDALRAADLSRASLAQADLTGRDLRGARLAGADLTGARLRGARLDEADLVGASMRGVDLESASLEGAKLSGADLAGANLRGAKLARAVLRGTTLTGANLDAAALDKADLDDLDAVGASFDRAVLRGATMWRARCEKASFREAILEDVDAEEARFSGCDMTRSRAERARFIGARFGEARLDDAEWPQAVLDGASFAKAFLVRAVVTKGSFARADLSGADLREGSLRAAVLRDAVCDGTIFDRTDLRGADLVGALLADDALSKARTTGAKRG